MRKNEIPQLFTLSQITEGESPADKKIRKPTVSVFVGHPGLEPGTSRL